jgi:hypothetical protein
MINIFTLFAGFVSPRLRKFRGLNRKRAVAMTSQPNNINIIVLNPPSGAWSPPGTKIEIHTTFNYRHDQKSMVTKNVLIVQT